MKNFLILLCAIVGGVVVGYYAYYAKEGVRPDLQYKEDSYSRHSVSTRDADRKLQLVLNRIAGTYEMYENRGVEGFVTIYVTKINPDGTGYTKYDTDDVEYYDGAYLRDSETIVFTGKYGGTQFTITSNGIEDPACRKYNKQVGYFKYGMRKL